MSDAFSDLEQVSLAQAAKFLGNSKRQIRYLVQKKHLPAVKFEGCWVISMTDLKELEKEWPIRPHSSSYLPSSNANPNFFEVDMEHILESSKSGFERDIPPHQIDASSTGSAMLVDLFRKDGARLTMTIPKIDGRIAADLVQAFLGD